MENILPLIVISPVLFFIVSVLKEMVMDYIKAPIQA
jgi:hypothetical protein